MALFAITYTHPDAAGWQTHLMAHIGWLQDRLADGSLLASGPFRDVEGHRAMLIMAAVDEAAMRASIATDPFAVEGLIADLTITRWDPIFGAFNPHSSMPGEMQTR